MKLRFSPNTRARFGISQTRAEVDNLKIRLWPHEAAEGEFLFLFPTTIINYGSQNFVKDLVKFFQSFFKIFSKFKPKKIVKTGALC